MQSAERVHNLIRGLHPWPHAFSFLNGRRFILRRSIVLPELNAPAGTVVDASGDRLTVAAGTSGVGILEIQAEGKRPMAPRDFLAGHRVLPGSRFSSLP